MPKITSLPVAVPATTLTSWAHIFREPRSRCFLQPIIAGLFDAGRGALALLAGLATLHIIWDSETYEYIMIP